jgi:hypothetical protein
MIKLTITPQVNETSNKTWWFVEWPIGGDVDPSKMCRLLEIVYRDVKYVGTVGLSIKLVGFTPRKQIGAIIETKPQYEVMFLDEDLAYRHPEHINGLSEYLQKQYVIVGVVFNSEVFAQLFKDKIEALWTFKALQRDYS